jgi:hypothetical protein
MKRGSRAQLSPNEGVTLVQVAMAAGRDTLRRVDVDQLTRLSLIEERDGTLAITQVGRHRLYGPPQPVRGTKSRATPFFGIR